MSRNLKRQLSVNHLTLGTREGVLNQTPVCESEHVSNRFIFCVLKFSNARCAGNKPSVPDKTKMCQIYLARF